MECSQLLSGDLFSFGWVTEAEEQESPSHIERTGGVQNNNKNINTNKIKVKAEIHGRKILAVTVNSPAVLPSSGHMLALFCGCSPQRICEHFWVPGRKEGKKKRNSSLSQTAA